MTLPIYTRRHWAKSDRQDHSRVHLLEHHLADVGACFEELLLQSTIRKRLARTAGLDDLDQASTERLCVFAALHDIGKANVGFQAQIWRNEDTPGGRRPRRAGHTSDIVPVLLGYDTEASKWFLDAIGWHEHIENWDSDGGNTASAMFVAAMSHHGEPLNLLDARQPNPEAWRKFGELSPRACVERIGALVRSWFPKAFVANAPPLPSAPAFQHMFLGLCTLADWIGSNEELFPFVDAPDDDYIDAARHRARGAIKLIGLNIAAQRDALTTVPGFSRLFDIPNPPNAIQRAAQDVPLDQPVVIMESETGSGKTEAALWRFARMYEAGLVDGLYFALPTRAAATQIHERVNRFAANLFSDHKPEPVLAVPGYIRAGDFSGQRHLSEYRVWWETRTQGHAPQKFWAAESAKRFLAAQIAVGTVDQAMMAALQVRHSHMRAGCLARNLLIVDEVHASDPYMSVILKELLNVHIGAGGYALLMSATLGSAARSQWLFRPIRDSMLQQTSIADAIKTPYPSIAVRAGASLNIIPSGENEQRKDVHIEARPLMHEFESVADTALKGAREGAKVLVIRNTVAHAVDTQRAVEVAAGSEHADLLFACKGVTTLHTGRFATEDRKLLDKAVEAQLGKNRGGGGRIVIGTQTLEQSLDIDAELLITDLCPVDVLLQRIGRLHRHQRGDRPHTHATPTCIVLTPPGDDLSPLLSPASGASRNGLGGFVYPDLRVLELTLRLVTDASSGHQPWRIPDMNRELVESATHPAVLEALVEDLGSDWQALANDIAGAEIGDNLTARNAVVRRDKSFLDREVVFPSDVEERIRTRLGDEGVEVRFSPTPPSPFCAETSISSLNLPGHMCQGLTPDETVASATTVDGFTFSIGDRRFVYDRLGLHRF